MPQLRYWDYLSPVPSKADNLVNRTLNYPGIYQGLELDVNSSGQLIVTIGLGLQADGIIWEETTDVEVGLSLAGAADYTVVATHVDELRQGGAPVEYSVESGILTSWADSIIVGWIYYPGGGVPLSTDYFINAPKAMEYLNSAERVSLRPIETIAPFPRSYYDSSASGINTTFTPLEWTTVGAFLMYQKCANSTTAPTPEQIVQHFQFYVDESPRPISFEFYVNIVNAPNTDLTVQIYGTDQVLVPVISGSPIVGSGTWEKKTVVVHRYDGVFSVDEPYTMRLIFNLGIGQYIKLARVKANFWPYPIS